MTRRFSKISPGVPDWIRVTVDGLAAEAVAQIDHAMVAEGRDRPARPRVDFLQVVGDAEDQPAIAAVLALPVVHAARCHALHVLVNPDLLAGRGVEGHERRVAAAAVQHAVGHTGLKLVSANG